MKKIILFGLTLLIALSSFLWAADQPCHKDDINGDCKIGMEEALAVLKAVAGLAEMPDPQVKNVEHVTNFNTRALADAQNDVASLEELSTVLAKIPFPASQSKKRNQMQSLFDFLTQSSISCAEISQDEDFVIITFNDSSLCLGMKGSIRISITDSHFILEFENVEADSCPINGQVTLSISQENETVSADLSFSNMSINNHPIDGDYSISYDKPGGILSSVDFKEKIQTYEIDGKNVQTQFKAIYNKLTGFSGDATMILNGQTYNSQFSNYFTDPMNGLPATGIMSINDIKLAFKQTFSKENPIISYFINDVPVNLKLTANKIQQGAKDFAQQIANFSTSLISGSNEDIIFIDRLTDIFSMMDISTLINNLKQTQGRSNTDLNQIIQGIDFSSCGTLSVNMNEGISIVYDFQAMPNCDNITGTITIVPSIVDQNLTLIFDNLLIKDCLVNGNTIITITSELPLIHANLAFDNMSVCGKTIEGNYDITYNRITGQLTSAHTKKMIETLFRNIAIQIPSTITYDSESGLNGFVAVPIMGKSYTCNFNSINIEEKCGLPLSGTLQINELEINFDELPCENRTIDAILDGAAIKIEMISNRISNEYQGILEKVNQLATIVVSKHGFDLEMLKQLSKVPSLTNLFQEKSFDFQQLINIVLNGEFNFICGNAKANLQSKSIEFIFNGSCEGVTGTVTMTLDQGNILIDYEKLSFDNGDCTIDGDMLIDVSLENTNFIYTQTANHLKICDNTLNGTLEVINGLGTPVVINRQGTDTLIINGEEYGVVSDISYTQNVGLNGSVEITKDGQAYYCVIENVDFDLACGIPTSGTITIDRMVIDFSDTTCENPEVTVIVFGMPIKMSLNEILEMIKKL